MPEARIRDATVDDADAIARVHVDVWRSSYGGIVPAEHLAALSYSARAEKWRDRIAGRAAARAHVRVAAAARGEIVGFAHGGTERSGAGLVGAELYAIYVRDQRRGVGRALFEDMAGLLRADAHTRMLVWVLSANPARAFYERRGGRAVATKSIVIGGAELEETAYRFDI